MANKKITNITVAPQSGVERTLYASWSFTASHLDTYEYAWQYYVNGLWFEGNSGSTDHTNTTYSVPANAIKVRFKVKPVAKTHKVKKKDKPYFTSSWSDWKGYNMPEASSIIPETPTSPTVSINKQKLTAYVDTTDEKTTGIRFEVVIDGSNTVFNSPEAPVKYGRASIELTVSAGHNYKVRARAFYKTTGTGSKPATIATVDLNTYKNNKGIQYKDNYILSEWSAFSSPEHTIPVRLSAPPIVRAVSSTVVEVSWNPVETAEKYEVQWTSKLEYFDASPDKVQSGQPDTGTIYYASVGSGDTWYFRVRATNDQGEAEWSEIRELVTGRRPDAPTTWSSVTTAYVGRTVYLYWTHNATDGSRETVAELELTVAGVVRDPIEVPNDVPEEDDTGTYSYILETDMFDSGSSVSWRVRTRGAVSEFSDWSISRTVDIYTPPTLLGQIGSSVKWYWNTFNFNHDDIYSAYGEIEPLGVDETDGLNVMTSFPLVIQLEAQPITQTPVVYYISIISTEDYDTTDEIGEPVHVHAGDTVFERTYNSQSNFFTARLLANDASFEQNIIYDVQAMVSMDSGLDATTVISFKVDWEVSDLDLSDSAVTIGEDQVCAYISPLCVDENEELVDSVTLGVYRRNFDGEFVEVESGIQNAYGTTVLDPHPPLDYARYRITARSDKTGKLDFYDLPPEPVGEEGIIIQWGERWTSFETDNPDDFANQPWTGSFLRLPYNVDVSDSNDVDVVLTEYIGRKHPVSYYGTQVGQHSQWKTDIRADDEETLYALRKLAVWMGDVYVREPNGTGYWAQIKVQYNIDHNAVVIPVSLDVTRVEGGL